MTLLINRKAVKKFALEKAKALRSHPFTRVSKEFVGQVDSQIRIFIEQHINSLPSKGKTI